MVASGMSETGSMNSRLKGHMPDRHGSVAVDKSTCTVVVTTMVATFSVTLLDMIGGTMAVVVWRQRGAGSSVGLRRMHAGWTRMR